MARPKKRSIPPKEAALFEAYDKICDDPLPDRVDLLQAIICALLTRIRRKDEREANQLVVLLHAITARAEYWKNQPAKPKDPLDAWGPDHREWEASYTTLLREMCVGETRRSSHCMETIVDQGTLLDRYLEDHPEILKLRNSTMRMEWIVKHAPTINDLLIPFPCFCDYYEKIIVTDWVQDQLKDILVEPRWLKKFASNTLTTARLRDAFLAMLHGVTIAEIVQIKKKPGLLVTEAPLDGYADRELLSFGLSGIKPRIPSQE